MSKQRFFQYFVSAGAILVLALILLHAFLANKSAQNGQNYDPYSDYVGYSVVLRLDRWAEAYDILGEMLEDLADGSAAAEQAAGFCEGVNIFSRTEGTDGAYDLVYGENTELSEALKDLTSLSAAVNQDVLEALSVEELQKLADVCDALSVCCNRNNVEQSLAYFLFIQDQGSAAYAASLQEARDLSHRFSEITAEARQRIK